MATINIDESGAEHEEEIKNILKNVSKKLEARLQLNFGSRVYYNREPGHKSAMVEVWLSKQTLIVGSVQIKNTVLNLDYLAKFSGIKDIITSVDTLKEL